VFKSNSNIVLVGHSHVSCIAAAERACNSQEIHVVELGKLNYRGKTLAQIMDLIVADCPTTRPIAIGVCLGGNEHNLLGIVENPQPFAVGDATNGTAPRNGENRHFIPHNLLKDHLKDRTDFVLMRAIFAAFGRAKPFCLNPPPPINDWKHIQANPGKFAEKLHLGPTPDSLKMRLFDIQSEVFEDFAKSEGAAFIRPGRNLLNAKGFLAQMCYDKDPTHGNVEYGKAMAQSIKSFAEAPI